MKRFIRCASTGGLRLNGSGRLIDFGDGTALFEVHFRDAGAMAEAQAMPGVTVLPALSTPAERLSAGVRSWLEAQGVTIEAGDQVLNLLRKLRDAKGTQFPVDLPY